MTSPFCFKGGRPSKAIDLAFKTEQFGALQMISEDLDENADPEVLRKCAEFFIDHEQFDKAVNLLVVAKKVCGSHFVYHYSSFQFRTKRASPKAQPCPCIHWCTQGELAG